MCPHNKKGEKHERQPKHRHQRKERSVPVAVYQPDGKNKEYIAERAGTFVSNDGKPHPIRSVFVYASKHDAQRSFHANSLVFAEGCIYNRNEEYTKYISKQGIYEKNGRKKKQ